MQSIEMWSSLASQNIDTSPWISWLNTKGLNGAVIDTADMVSLQNTELKRAVKLVYEPESRYPVSAWIGQFGDEEGGIIDILNLVYQDVEQGKTMLNLLFPIWSNQYLSIEDVKSKIDRVLQ